jgi:hypothetical protein
MDIDIPGQTLKLEEFKINTLIKDENGEFINPRIVMIAPSGSGKSWIVRNILYEMKDIPCGTVIAPTDKMNKFYDDFLPSSFIHHEYNQSIIPKILGRQKKILEKNERRMTEHKREVDPRAFLVMDDCMATKHLWVKDPNVLEIMNQGRHFKLTYILTMQYCLGIQPELRTQFNFVFLLGEDNAASRRKLHEHWAGVFPKFDLFEQVFLQVTSNYGCMVINNRIKTLDLTKKVFWFRAKKVPNFTLGIPQYIKYHEENYNPEHQKKEGLFDLINYGSKKKSNNVIVKLVN